jgi:hypothetical protein
MTQQLKIIYVLLDRRINLIILSGLIDVFELVDISLSKSEHAYVFIVLIIPLAFLNYTPKLTN